MDSIEEPFRLFPEFDEETAPGAEKPASDAENVALDGDVVLVVGPERRKIIANSVVLRHASKYFDNLFSERWSQGQKMSVSSRREITFPEDDFRSLLNLCNLMHLQNDKVPDDPGLQEILKVAVMADKFDCLSVLAFAKHAWLADSQIHAWCRLEDLVRAMVAAKLLDHATAFKEITSVMVFSYKESFHTIRTMEDVSGFVSTENIFMLEQNRSQQRLSLYHYLTDYTMDFGGHPLENACEWQKEWATSITDYRENLRLSGITIDTIMVCEQPFLSYGETLEELLSWAEEIPPPTLPPTSALRACKSSDHKIWLSDLQGGSWPHIEEWKDGNGICLDCLRWLEKPYREPPDPDRRSCRVDHL